MKHIMFAVAIVLSSGLSYGQEAEEEGVEYEKLKVLEPIIGTWHATIPDRGFEAFHTYSWSDTKRMIVASGTQKRGKPGEVPSETALSESPRKEFIVWNHTTNCIERYLLLARAGLFHVTLLSPIGDGKFTVAVKSNTKPGTGGTPATMLTVTDDELIWKFAEGEWIWKRVE
jgi:hypothetical protein